MTTEATKSELLSELADIRETVAVVLRHGDFPRDQVNLEALRDQENEVRRQLALR